MSDERAAIDVYSGVAKEEVYICNSVYIIP